METKPRHKITDRDRQLLKELHKLVTKRVQHLPNSRKKYLKIKLLILPIIYFSLYLIALTQSDKIWLFFICYSLMGIMAVIIFCELIHELCHKNIFRKAQYNSWAFHLFDLLGANSYIWQQRHMKLHHRFPNVNGWDADVEQKGPLVIFPNEQHQKIKKYQPIYAFLLYPLFMLNWLLIRDFRDYFSSNRVIRKVVKIPKLEYIKLFLFKTIYIFLIVLVPWLFFRSTLIQAIMGLLILTISGSLLAMIVLLTPHVNSSNKFPVVNSNNEFQYSWLRHQLNSTNDIKNTNWFIRNIMGNFNYHIAHHLFPKISSVYAPEITQVIKTFLLKNNLPYRSYTLSVSFKKHYELICNNANKIKELYVK
jgi:linoleoyl-CoA desaturase